MISKQLNVSARQMNILVTASAVTHYWNDGKVNSPICEDSQMHFSQFSKNWACSVLVLRYRSIYAKTLSIGLCRRCSPKSGFWDINGWSLTLETKWYPRNIFTTKTRVAVHWAFYGLLCTRCQGTKKVCNVTTSVCDRPTAYFCAQIWGSRSQAGPLPFSRMHS